MNEMQTQDTPSPINKITEIVSKVPVPNPIPKEKVVCIYNKHAQKVCYGLPTRNVIQCNDELCKINYASYDRTLLHNDFPDGIHIGLVPNGAFSKLHIFGVFPKNELESVKKIFGNEIRIESVKEIHNPTFGLPDPPKSCRWTIWKDECQPYLKDLGWKWSPFRGWKKEE